MELTKLGTAYFYDGHKEVRNMIMSGRKTKKRDHIINELTNTEEYKNE